MKTENQFKQSTETASKDQAVKQEIAKDEILETVRKIVSSVLITLSGLLLLTDKVIYFNLSKDQLFGFHNESTFVFMTCIGLAFLVNSLGGVIGKPYKIAYLAPVWIGAINLVWVFRPDIQSDDVFLHEYTLGTVVAFIMLVAVSHVSFKKAREIRNKRLAFLYRTLDMDLVPVVQDLIHHIMVTINDKFIKTQGKEVEERYLFTNLSKLEEIDRRTS